MTYIGTECEHPADDCSEIPPDPRSRAGRGGCCPDGFGDGGVLAAQSGAVQHSTLTVVSFNPFTGPDASFGPEMVAGCQAAATAVNAAGGVLGNKVACASVDTRAATRPTRSPARRRCWRPRCICSACWARNSDEADSTAPLINAAKVPMFADTGEASFDHTTLPYFWRMFPADDSGGYAMALYAKQKGYLRGARRCSATTSARRAACRRC